MESVKKYMNIWSPIEPRNYHYSITFEKNGLIIKRHQRCSTVTWSSPNSKPVWGDKDLFEMMKNIDNYRYPPSNLKEMLEYIWEEWNKGNIASEDLQPELDALADYISATRQTISKTPFWRKYS